jgi:hypothetical protein
LSRTITGANLCQEATLDGERITRERAEAECARRLAEEAQPAFPALMPDKG